MTNNIGQIYAQSEIYALSIIDDASKILINIPGVVQVGLTHSYVTGIGDEYQILVYIKDESVISLLPKNIYGMRIVWTISGEITIKAFVTEGHDDKRFLSERNIDIIQSMQKGRYRPVVGGVSGGIFATVKSSGTIGCIAKEAGGSGRTVLVSNNHVFVLDVGTIPYKGVKGDPIIQPGVADGGVIGDKVATLEKWVRIEASGNIVDAAYAIPTVDTATPNLCNLYAGPSIAPTIGMAVSKGGRTTGCTNGQIESIKTTVNVKYKVNSASQGEITFIAQFTDCIAITGSGPVSQVGDSGSAWVTTSGNNVVGLNFAGTDAGGAIACKAKNIESKLGIIFGDGGGGNGGGGCTTPVVSLTVSSSGGGVAKHYKCNDQGWCEEDPTGEFTENTCGGTCTSAVRFTCATLPDGTKYCKSDVNGEFATLTECNAACGGTMFRYTCKTTGTTRPIKYCSISPTGEFATRKECEKSCEQ